MNNIRTICNAADAEEARCRSKAGEVRQLQQYRTNVGSNPARGGSTGYDVKHRLHVLAYADGHGVKAASRVFGIGTLTIYRWYERLHPYWQTGNAGRQKLVGYDQMLLSLAVFIYPTACADEICAFIVANGGAVYERYAIYKRLKELNLLRKKASIEAHEGYSEENIQREFTFWNLPAPLGVWGERRSIFVDFDEARFTLKGKQNKYGYAGKPYRVRDTGHYNRHMASVNLLMAVEAGNIAIPNHLRGSIAKPRRWFLLTQRNCDQHLFGDFCEMVCADIEQDPCAGDEARIFLWDNLSAHKTDYVANIVENCNGNTNFSTIARPPYKPKYAPIEYIFCEVAMQLQKEISREWNAIHLRRALQNICLSVSRNGALNRTFAHCGY